MKHIVTDEWCYGSTDEYFTEEFPTKAEAIKYCKDCDGGYIGRIIRLEFDEEDICYDETGYHLQNQLYDEVGDVSENWTLSAEQEKELSKILAKDIIKYINENNLQPNVFSVREIEWVDSDKQDGEQE